MSVKPFWMIYGEGKSAPNVRHDSLAKARAEAERLAVAVGVKFYVLKCVGVAEQKPQPAQWSAIK